MARRNPASRLGRMTHAKWSLSPRWGLNLEPSGGKEDIGCVISTKNGFGNR